MKTLDSEKEKNFLNSEAVVVLMTRLLVVPTTVAFGRLFRIESSISEDDDSPSCA
jgi:hypothetical protein